MNIGFDDGAFISYEVGVFYTNINLSYIADQRQFILDKLDIILISGLQVEYCSA